MKLNHTHNPNIQMNNIAHKNTDIIQHTTFTEIKHMPGYKASVSKLEKIKII